MERLGAKVMEVVVLGGERRVERAKNFFFSERLVCDLILFFASVRHPQKAPILVFERADGRRE